MQLKSATAQLMSSFRRLYSTRSRRNVTTTSLAALITALSTLALYPLNLAYLGMNDYGVWLALSVVINLTQMGTVGLGPAVTKYVAEYLAKEEVRHAQQCIVSAYLLTGAVGLVFAVVFASLPNQVVSLFGFEGVAQETAKRLIPQIAFLSAYSVIAQIAPSALAGLGRTDLTAVIAMLGRLLSLGTAWALLQLDFGVTALVIGQGVSAALNHLASNWFIRKQVRFRLFEIANLDAGAFRQLFAVGSTIAGSNGLQLLLSPFNRWLLARESGPASVTVFEIAWGSSMQLRGLMGTGLRALLPDFSRSVAQRDANRVRHLLNQAYRLCLYAGIPLFSVLLVSAPSLLPLWLRAGYDPSLLAPFRIMMVGAFISLMGVPDYYFLIGASANNKILVAHAILTVTNGVLASALYLSGQVGPTGLCLAVTAGMLGTTAWLIAQGRRQLSAFNEV